MMIRQAFFATTVAISVGSISFAWADARPNPYTAIADRNPFGIKDPPPPPPPPPEVPIVPMAKVVLTGMLSIFGREPRVLLEISEQEQGKQPIIKKPILKEGEREGPVEIISIDMVKSVVRIKNGTVESNLVFEVAKAGGPAAPLPVSTAALHPSTGMGSPMIISPGGANSAGRPGSGVSLMGSTALPAANPVQTAAYQPTSANSYAPGSQASSLGASLGATGLGANSFGVSTYGANDGSKPVPSRPLRTDNQAGQPPGMTAAEMAALGMTVPPVPGISAPAATFQKPH